MTCRHRLSFRPDRALLPCLQNIVHAMERPFFRPQYKPRALNFFVEICLVVHEVNRSGRTIILADGVNRIGLAKGAKVFMKHGGTYPVGQRVCELASAEPQQSTLEKIFSAVLDHGFGKWRWLNEQKPVIKNCREFLRDALIQQMCRHNIQNDELRESLGVIESQTMRRAPTPVMTYEREFLETQMPHDFHLILRHRPL